ncbi:MAG: iron ABC transporter permease [Planctomycetes bacterium]|nr:iron ABC transporter permease [Planctomycetota bacterium]
MAAALLIAFVFMLLAVLFGSVVPWHRAAAFWNWSSTERLIVMEIRLPRALLAAAIGIALGSAGAGVQGVLRNPLAEPYLLGMSGGGALVVSMAKLAGWDHGLFLTSLAFLGALAAGATVLAIASGLKRAGTTGIVLAGIMVNAFCGACVQLAYSRAAPGDAKDIIQYLIGRIPDDASVAAACWVLAAALAGVVALTFLSRPMNLLALGETTAASGGISPRRLRTAVLVIAGFLTAFTVAVAGPIGFVGLVVPHAVRVTGGGDNRWVVPGAAFAGAAFLLAADTFTRVFASVNPLPVGVVTGLVGTPVFLALVVRRWRRA